MLGLVNALALGAVRRGGGGGWPLRGEDGSLPTLDLWTPSTSERYYWNAAEHLRTDLVTVAGSPTWDAEGLLIDSTDRIKVPDDTISSWFNWGEGTLYVEWFRENNEAQGYIFSMRGGSGGTAVRLDLAINTDRRVNFSLIDGSLGNPAGYYASNTAQLSVWPRTNRGRAVMGYKVGQKPGLSDRGVLLKPTGPDQAALSGTFPTEAVLGYFRSTNLDQLNGYIKRVVYWPKKFSDAWITALSAKSQKNLHLLGDSFATASLLQAVAAAGLDDDRTFTLDGVGGSTLAEQASRYASSAYKDRTLVIMDGGLTDADPVAQIGAIVENCQSGRWFYVQSGIDRTSTPSQVDAKLAIDATIQATYPNNYVDSYDYMRANGTGSTTGSGGGEVWPANCYTDDLHPSAEGNTVLGACIEASLVAKGW